MYFCGSSVDRGALVSGAPKRRRVIGQLPDDLHEHIGKVVPLRNSGGRIINVDVMGAGAKAPREICKPV
eukprot:9474401-Pyramimonas_sp.AAC.1